MERVTYTADEKQDAKRIILALVALADGEFKGKAALFKAFYYAHVSHWRHQRGALTTYPIVWMPDGPGIHDFATLLGELENGGVLTVSQAQSGHALFATLSIPDITPEEQASLMYAIGRVANKSYEQLSAEAHVESRSWQEAERGEELDIAIDALGELEWERIQQQKSIAKSVVDELFR